MKRIIPITLTALLAGCTGSSYTTNITTETSEEVYQVTQPIEVEDNNFQETEVVTASESEKRVVKLTPEDTSEVKPTEDKAVKILPPTKKQEEMHNRYGYTLQVLALSRKTDLNSYADMLGNEQPVWMNRKTVNNMPWYTILYGDFATPNEARAAIKRLPAEIQKYGPFVRSINSIKNSDNPELHKLN